MASLPLTPFEFQPYSAYKMGIDPGNHEAMATSLAKNGFFMVPLTFDKQMQKEDFDTAQAMLNHVVANAAPELQTLFDSPETTRGQHLQKIKHFFHISAGKTRASKPLQDEAKTKRLSSFDRYPRLNLGDLRPLWPSHSHHHGVEDLEAYLERQVLRVDLERMLFSPQAHQVKTQVLACHHLLPHGAKSHEPDLTPVCPINPHTYVPSTDTFRCHLAVTDIPFAAVRGSHKPDFLHSFDELLTDVVTTEQLESPESSFQLPFAVGPDSIDPLDVFGRQVVFKIPRGHLLICDPALSFVPLREMCVLDHLNPQWACSFMLSKSPTMLRSSAAAKGAVEEEGPLLTTQKDKKRREEEEEGPMLTTKKDRKRREEEEEGAKSTNKKDRKKREEEEEMATLAVRKTHKLTRPLLVHTHTHHLAYAEIPPLRLEQREAARARILDLQRRLTTASTDNERGLISQQLSTLKRLVP